MTSHQQLTTMLPPSMRPTSIATLPAGLRRAVAKLGFAALIVGALTGCTRTYSPNTYSSAAVQQANEAVQGVIVGYREVEISPDGSIGAVTGGAAGGALGAQTPGTGFATTLGTIGGSFVGGLLGAAVEKSAGTTTGLEYLVRKADGKLLSVTQKDPTPLAVGEKVVVILGKQARIVADYSVPLEALPPVLPPTAAKTQSATRTPASPQEPLSAVVAAQPLSSQLPTALGSAVAPAARSSRADGASPETATSG